MGLRTLAEFREDLSLAIGGRGPSNRWLDRRINAGYMDLATTILHAALRSTITLEAEEGVHDYLIGDVIGISTVYHDDRVLMYIDPSNAARIESVEGPPRMWTDVPGGFRVYPAPEDTMDLLVDYYSEPPPLVADDSTTVLEARWDHAIHLLAAHFAFLDLGITGEGSASQEFLQRAHHYIQTRVKDHDVRTAPPMPLNVARSFDDLTRLRRMP